MAFPVWLRRKVRDVGEEKERPCVAHANQDRRLWNIEISEWSSRPNISRLPYGLGAAITESGA